MSSGWRIKVRLHTAQPLRSLGHLHYGFVVFALLVVTIVFPAAGIAKVELARF